MEEQVLEQALGDWELSAGQAQLPDKAFMSRERTNKQN
jgi:hypothetical protein